MAQLLSIAGAAFVATQLALMAYGRVYLAALAGGLGSAAILGAGILWDNVPLIVLSAAVIGSWLVWWFWRGGPRGRRRAGPAIGDESRQLRDGLVRRMRARRAARREPSPQPSR
jgi:hypothetical protein